MCVNAIIVYFIAAKYVSVQGFHFSLRNQHGQFWKEEMSVASYYYNNGYSQVAFLQNNIEISIYNTKTCNLYDKDVRRDLTKKFASSPVLTLQDIEIYYFWSDTWTMGSTLIKTVRVDFLKCPCLQFTGFIMGRTCMRSNSRVHLRVHFALLLP